MKATNNSHVKMYVCLGTQPITKTTRDGKCMANFYATNTSAKKECLPHETSNVPTSKWFRVISWGKVAETAARHLQKGTKVLLMGTVSTQQFTTRKGEIKTKQVVTASNLILLDSGKSLQVNNAA